jgi:predicted enzyme related to lactoylglutathione lyase
MSDYRGRFLWFELMTTDVEGAKAFYTQALGWGTQTFDTGEPAPADRPPYVMWTAGGIPVGGLARLPEEAKAMGAPPHWLGYVGTPDVDATVQMVQDKGGRVYLQPMDVPKVGRIAIVADPQGATIGLYTPTEPPKSPLGEPRTGEISWHELTTTSWQDAWSFYEPLFGWNKLDGMDMGPMGIYQIYGLGQISLGGMFSKTPDMPMPPNWMYYVRVSDINEAVERIKAGGGKVLNGPMEVPGGSRIAQCMDPQGAMFAVHALK